MVGKKQAPVGIDERVKMYKEQLVTLRAILRQEMEREYDVKSAEIQKNIDTIAFSYAENGESMSKVAKRLGTTNWKTAADAVRRARERAGVVERVSTQQAEAYTVDRVPDHPSGRSVYKITTDKAWTGGAHTATLYVEPEVTVNGMTYPEEAMFLDDVDATRTPLHDELRNNWTTSPIAARIKEMEEN